MGDPNVRAVWLERLKEHKIYKIRFIIPRGINMQNNILCTNLYKNLDKVIDNS